MADIELVIKIDEELYNATQTDMYRLYTENTGHTILEAIKNGIVLSKGHGDLKDVDEIERLWQKGDYDSLASAVIFAPTVIEADKAGDTDGTEIHN